MQYGKILRTVAHLRMTQVWHQVWMRLHKPVFRQVACPDNLGGKCGVELAAAFIEKPVSMDGDVFTFLNLPQRFDDWNDTRLGMLWAYNLNYMDYLLQPGVSAFDGKMWIDRFLRELPARTVGLDPYPTALRVMNWAKFFSLYYTDKDVPTAWRDALYSQLLHLERRLEFHLLGNHLLEDAFGLYIGWMHFGEYGKHLRRARRLVLRELKEQTLTDGAHYEQSPMYHCVLLDRLLDVLNFAKATDEEGASVLQEIAEKQLAWLEAIVWNDKTIPLFGDSAIGIAPKPEQILDYARRLGLSWEKGSLGISGYRKLGDARLEAVVDVGAVTATYQPGHTHSDSLSFEMRVDGKPLVVDTGISTYEKNARRQYERSYAAHNVAQIGDEEPFEVWGGFRVGRTASVRLVTDETNRVEAERSGQHKASRVFALEDSLLRISDNVLGHIATARFHLAPGVTATLEANGIVQTSLATFRFEGRDVRIALKECEVSTEYNRFCSVVCIEVQFHGTLDTFVNPFAA